MRDQIWATLNDLKFKSYYISLLISKFQKWDRNINILIVFASSGSIAAWAVWSVYPFIWSLIIAASQLLTVLKPYIPYYKYVKELNDKSLRIENLNVEFERLWYKIQNNKITQEESSEVYFQLRKEINEILIFSEDIILVESKELILKANEKMKTFLKANYGIVI